MQRQNYMITAEEVAESMGISLGYAYKLLRKLNKELADQGYVTVSARYRGHSGKRNFMDIPRLQCKGVRKYGSIQR